MRILKNYYLKYFVYIFLAMLFLACEALCELQIPGYIANIITNGIAPSNIAVIKNDGLNMLIYSGIGFISAVSVNFITSQITTHIIKDMRGDLYSKIINFSHAQYEIFETSSLITRCTNDLTQIQVFTQQMFRITTYVPIVAIGGLLKAKEYSANINSIELVLGIGIAVCLLYITVRLIIVLPRTRYIQKSLDSLNRISSDALVGMPDIRALNQETYEKNRFERVSLELKKHTQFYNRVMHFIVPSLTSMMFILSIVILVIIAKVIEDISQIANMMAFIQYVMLVTGAFSMVGAIMFLVPRAIVSYKRVNEIVNINNVNKVLVDKIVDGVDITFEDVKFNFNQTGQNALNGATFKINNGEMCAIVGPTGSGKSSIVKLLTKIINKDSGRIKIGNTNIEEITSMDMRKMVACVMQKSFLFKGNIKSNVAYSDESMSDEKVDQALTISSAKEFVDNLESKIMSKVEQDGANLSGGQKQRLNIARTIAKDAQIYIFDDSFSALDFKTDLQVRKDINTYLKGKTVILIAQRISTITNADKIIVLDKGRVVGVGKHEELIKTCPKYIEIATSQLEDEDE